MVGGRTGYDNTRRSAMSRLGNGGIAVSGGVHSAPAILRACVKCAKFGHLQKGDYEQLNNSTQPRDGREPDLGEATSNDAVRWASSPVQRRARIVGLGIAGATWQRAAAAFFR